jgi:hypothetical protein
LHNGLWKLGSIPRIPVSTGRSSPSRDDIQGNGRTVAHQRYRALLVRLGFVSVLLSQASEAF